MEEIYKEIIKFVYSSGKRITKRGGEIKDIGVAKEFLTEEDLRIERDLEKLIKRFDKTHELFAEEEHEEFPKGEDIWVADPISGTRPFILGLPHYAIAIAYTKNKEVQFSVVYDPSMNELYTAYLGEGAFLNGKPIKVSKNKGEKKLKIMFVLSHDWNDEESGKKMFNNLMQFFIYRTLNSAAVSYCHVACGRYDGIISLTKDAFPEIVGSLIVREAGGKFTNKNGENIIEPDDRYFVGGNNFAYDKLYPLLKSL